MHLTLTYISPIIIQDLNVFFVRFYFSNTKKMVQRLFLLLILLNIVTVKSFETK